MEERARRSLPPPGVGGDEPATQTQRAWLEARGILLGPTWQLDSQPATDISAYVGISPRGTVQPVPPEELLDNLLHDEAVSACLVHFMELTHATPFRYLAKLICRDFKELDRVTDVLFLGAGSGSLRGVAFDTKTFIVGQGSELLPLVIGQPSSERVTPDTRGIDSLAQSVLGPLGPDAIARFNGLDRRLQTSVLDGMAELLEKTAAGTEGAIRAFGEAALGGALPGTFHGPVAEIARVVDAACRDIVRRMVRHVFGRDLGRAQADLELPTRKLGELTVEQIAVVLRTAQKRDDFEFLGTALDDEWLELFERFAQERKPWARAGGRPVATTPGGEMKAARHVMSDGLDLLRWLRDQVLPALADGGPQPPGRRPARYLIFISYSREDAGIAERIASELRSLGLPVWYAPWSIPPGDSIPLTISDALRKTHTLLALLSPHSVASRWVENEWESALASRNAGEDVAVVPVLIDPVDVPEILHGIQRIDMTPARIDTGFTKLREFVAARSRTRHREA